MDLTVVHVAETSNSDDEFQLDADFAAMKISPLKNPGHRFLGYEGLHQKLISEKRICKFS